MILKVSISVKETYVCIMENTNSQAEIKPVKFGEPLTGNPEPSRSESSDPACVETRRRVCINCGKTLSEKKYKNAKYCSTRCSSQVNAYNHAVKTGKIKNPGVGSGGAQLGEANHMYKTGIGNFSQRAFAHYGRKCNRCTSIRFLVVHHRDHDRTNNHITNLEVLCKGCHQVHHEHRDASGRYTKG